jgi:hypothetical protein
MLPVIVSGVITGLIDVVEHLQQEETGPELVQPVATSQEEMNMCVDGVFLHDRDPLKALAWR